MRLVGRLAALEQALLAAGEAPEHGLPVVGRALELERTLEVVPTVEVETDGLGVERLAVVERDAVLQRERPRGSGRVGLPLGRQAGNDVGRPRCQGDQALEHLVDRAERLAVGNQRAVEDDRVGSGAEDQLTAGRSSPTSITFVVASAAGSRQNQQCRRKQ